MAIELYEKCLKIDPNNDKNFMVYTNRSLCYEMLKDYQQSLVDAMNSLSLKKDWAKGYLRAGRSCEFMGNFAEAAQHYQAGLQHEPTNDMLRSGLSRVQLLSTVNIAEMNAAKLNAETLATCVGHNMAVLQSPQFANAIKGMSANLGNRRQYMHLVMVDLYGKIVDLQAPLSPIPLKPGEKEKTENLQNGKQMLCYMIVLAKTNKIGMMDDDEPNQIYMWKEWNNSSQTSTLKSMPMSDTQKFVLNTTMTQANNAKTLNTNI